MNKHLRIILFGSLVWAVPYLIAMGLFPTGLMTNDPMLFQTIMSLSAAVTSAVATCYYFWGERKVSVKDGWLIT
ncbi:hypothetical protein GF352_00050, partial [archaeon]|nr:hypothetical protein [archaeon]